MDAISYQEYDECLALFELDIKEIDKMYSELLVPITLKNSQINTFVQLFYIHKDYIGPDLVKGSVAFHQPFELDPEIMRLILLTFSKNFRKPNLLW